MDSKNLLLIFLLFPAINLLANQDSMPQLSTAGIGDAKFGMTPDAVERALGRKLEFSKGKANARLKNARCQPASINGVSGVDLLFTNGNLDGIYTDKSTVTTKSGFKVGDPEASIIRKFRTDPTYERDESRYEGADLMQIAIGRVVTGRDTVLRFSSRRGMVVNIKAGHADYVFNDDDYCAE